MFAKVFLGVVGAAYVSLAIWCAVQPARTSQSVGFSLQPGSGQSEYFVVYGGLQLALGLVFLIPLLQPEMHRFALLSCLVIHGSLVLFRAISFGLYSGIQTTTYVLAAIEWAIFLGSLWSIWQKR